MKYSHLRNFLVITAISAAPASAMTPPSVSAQVSPRSAVTGLGTPTGDGLGVDLFVRQSTRDHLQSGRDRVSNPNGEKTETWQTTLQLDYRVANHLTAIVSVPHIDSTAHFRDPVSGNKVSQKTTGLGDVALIGKYSFFRNRVVEPSAELFGLFGLEFPTGSTTLKDDAGVRLPITQQPGSGEIDYIIGAAGVWGLPRVTTYGDVSYKINGQTNYRYGNFFALNVGANYTLLSARSVSLVGEANVEIAARDTSREGGAGVFSGNQVQNTGSSRAYLSPGVQWRPRASWSLSAGVQIPVYQNLNGTQLASNLIYNAGVFTRFGDRAAR